VQLPDVWTHRTAARVWSGPLDDVGEAKPPAAALRAHRKAALARSLEVLWVLARTEFRARYRAQALGAVWSLLSPLVMMGIMSLVFTKVFRTATDNLPIFLLIGLITWEWVTSSIAAGTSSFVNNADIIKRTVFAREVLPMSVVLSYGVNFAMASSMLLLFIPIFPDAFKLTHALLAVPILLGLLMALLAGITLATSVLNVIYRDVAYLVNTSLLLLYWLTPVIYPIEVIPEPYQQIMGWNPLGGILNGLRGAIMSGVWPAPDQWMRMLLPTIVVVGLGWIIFKRNERLVLDYV
jgi:ABC-type polysaccharide/polyol phosphate export permease